MAHSAVQQTPRLQLLSILLFEQPLSTGYDYLILLIINQQFITD